MPDGQFVSVTENVTLNKGKDAELPRTIHWMVAEVEMLQHTVDDLKDRLQPVLENAPSPSIAEVESDPTKVPGQVITSEHAQKIQNMVTALHIEINRIRTLIDRLEV